VSDWLVSGGLVNIGLMNCCGLGNGFSW